MLRIALFLMTVIVGATIVYGTVTKCGKALAEQRMESRAIINEASQ